MAKMIQRVISTNGRNVMLSLAIILYLRVPIGAIGWGTALQAEGRGFDSAYNEQANRKVVGAGCSVYVAECSESSS